MAHDPPPPSPVDDRARRVAVNCLVVAVTAAAWMVVGNQIWSTCYTDPEWRGSAESSGTGANFAFVSSSIAIAIAMFVSLLAGPNRRARSVVAVMTSYGAIWAIAAIITVFTGLSCAGLLD